MTAMVDEFADIEDGHGFLLQNAQWANLDRRRRPRPRVGRGAQGDHGAAGERRLVHRAPQRDRGHGTRDHRCAPATPVVHYALTDEVDVRITRGARSKPRSASTPPAERREIVPFAATATRWRAGDDLEAFIAGDAADCRLRRWAGTACSRPTR